MRFLDTTTFALEDRPQAGIVHDVYAVLSHRWVGEEIKLQDLSKYIDVLRSGTPSSPQVEKIRSACNAARIRGIQWLWMDTCCIDKQDAREYSEAINSMFNWYRNAKLCITFLYDFRRQGGSSVATGREAFIKVDGNSPSEWFERGWTLQELLAPREMEFYDMDWQYIGTKRQLAGALSEITKIDSRYLTHEKDLNEASIAMKISWMSRRRTTYPEDMSYSTLGIFNVNMPLLYGEGAPRAFRRLQESLLASPFMDESLFAWKMPDVHAGKKCNAILTDFDVGQWGLLAGSPEWFSTSGDIQVDSGANAQDRRFRLTQKGIEGPIRIKLRKDAKIWTLTILVALTGIGLVIGDRLLRPVVRKKAMEDYAFTLNCFREGSSRENVAIYLRPVHIAKNVFLSMRSEDGRLFQAPYVECKRVQCDTLGSSLKPITNWGDGIVFQPRPGH